MNVNQVADL